MELLPLPHLRSALLESLSHLIQACGFETFVRGPILEPTSRYFPDAWEPSARGVRALSLRLLAYAGLEASDAFVELFSDDRAPGERHHVGTAAWFAGIDDEGVCRFGVDERQLELGDSVVGTMCHEIAHAFREHHELVGEHRQIEEENTDLTTVYLGFGILTTNNAYRFRKSGAMAGASVTTQWSTSQTGYLSPQAMAFLLAAQAVARDLAASDVKRISSHLEPNQRDFFRASHKELSRDPDSLRVTLGVPPREAWPSERRLELPALPADAQFVPGEDASKGGGNERALPWNQAGRVFRVRRRPARGRHWGGLVGAIAGGIAASKVEGVGWKLAAVALGMLSGAVVGSVLGPRAYHECSESGCVALIPVGARQRCPGCGGAIQGVIDDPSDRLEVEEALDRGHSVEETTTKLAQSRRRKSWKRVRTAVLLVAALAAVVGFAAFPSTMDIRTLRQRTFDGATVRVTGEVVELLDELGVRARNNDGTNTSLAAFSMFDGTDTLQVWYEVKLLDRPLRAGARVRLWGHFVAVDVYDEATRTTSDSRRFLVTSLSVDD